VQCDLVRYVVEVGLVHRLAGVLGSLPETLADPRSRHNSLALARRALSLLEALAGFPAAASQLGAPAAREAAPADDFPSLRPAHPLTGEVVKAFQETHLGGELPVLSALLMAEHPQVSDGRWTLVTCQMSSVTCKVWL
jgi:hypothetical protein